MLTDPKTLNDDRLRIREELREFASSGRVRFVFSAAIVSESVPMSADAAHLAERRADFLSSLCAKNALVSFDRLLSLEIQALANQKPERLQVIDPRGDWFPELPGDLVDHNPFDEIRRFAENEFALQGMSRQQRRASARKLVKNGTPGRKLRTHLESFDVDELAARFLDRFPMKPEYAKEMTSYFLGRSSGRDFQEALLASLRDPRWMMKWFSTDHSLSSPIAEIVRKPGQELGGLLRQLTMTSSTMAKLIMETGEDSQPTGVNGELTRRWQDMIERQMVSIARTVASRMRLELGDISAADVDTYCPGLSTVMRSMYSSVWSNVAGGRKEQPSDSQPVDALHAMYAPYVQVFRADRFMAPHIQKQVKRHDTVVVSQLTKLLETLQVMKQL
jgi:hypothetical protein